MADKVDFEEAEETNGAALVDSYTFLNRGKLDSIVEQIDVLVTYGVEEELYFDSYGEDRDAAFARIIIALGKIEDKAATLQKEMKAKYEAMLNG